MLNTERRGGVLVATLFRPPVNALNDELVGRLEAALDEAVADDAISVLHWRSEAKAFCGGADLALMRACFATPDGPDAMMVVVRRMQALFARIEAAPVVSIAEIAGAAMGGGFELALACDLRIAAIEAKIGLPEARLGLLPGAGGTQRLTRLCGRAVATRLILGAEVLDGAAAERLGLVHWATPRAALAGFAADVAERFARIPRAALAANKRCIALAGEPGEAGFAEELAGTRRLYGDLETRRRVAAFLDKSA